MAYKNKPHKILVDWSDPYKALFMAVVKQACQDLRPYRVRENPKRALEATLFLSVCGAEYCEATGWEVEPQHWEEVLSGKL